MPESADRPEALRGVESWLASPIRLAILALAAVVLATLATTFGELELDRAGGFDEHSGDTVLRQGALWALWALAMPAFLWVAVRLQRRISSWIVLSAAHALIAAAVGASFLYVEIQLIEFGQTAEETANIAQRIKERQEAHRQMSEWREAKAAALEAGEEPPPRPSPQDWRRDRRRDRPGSEDDGNKGDRDGRGGRDHEPAREGDTRDGDADRERDRQGTWRPRTIENLPATGDLRRDFGRRWPYRVPRYALVYFSLIGIGLGIRAFLAGQRQERHAARLAADLDRARLEALKGQLHPHFLFNSLHSVGGLIRTSRSDDALTALASIGDLLRTSLDAAPEQFVPLVREIELFERYLAVEALRLGERLQIHIEVPKALHPAEVPTFIAQPLVENAIKHAIATRAEGGSVTLRARQEGDERLIIEVDDDGPGFDPKPDHVGVGIAHVRGRLEALFGDSAHLQISSLPARGPRARLTLPLDDLES